VKLDQKPIRQNSNFYIFFLYYFICYKTCIYYKTTKKHSTSSTKNYSV